MRGQADGQRCSDQILPRESLLGILKPHDFSWIQNFLSAIQTHISVVAGGYFHKLQ